MGHAGSELDSDTLSQNVYPDSLGPCHHAGFDFPEYGTTVATQMNHITE